MFDITNFIIDRALNMTMYDKSTHEVLWRLTQIEDFSISNSSEEKTAVDAQGTTVAKFFTAKSATMSGSNSFLDLNLAAAQMGTTKVVADSSNKITVPVIETFTVEGTSNEKITLTHTPVGASGLEIGQIYAVNSDSSLGTKYVLGSSASATEFALDAGTKEITLPIGLTKGEQIIVFYDCEKENAVSVTNSATEFPTSGYLVTEVLGCNICNTSEKYTAKILAPNAMLSSNFDLNFSTDGKHPFEIECSQDYCDTEKKLYSIIVDED